MPSTYGITYLEKKVPFANGRDWDNSWKGLPSRTGRYQES
jgi:hypothetical protein